MRIIGCDLHARQQSLVIWLPTKELLDLRALVLHRHQWVRIRTRIQNALQAMALANGLRRGPSLWSYDGQAKIAFLPMLPHASYRRSALQALYRRMDEEIDNLMEGATQFRLPDHTGGARQVFLYAFTVLYWPARSSSYASAGIHGVNSRPLVRRGQRRHW